MSERSAIIMPVYNQERFLGRALDSLDAQTCRDFAVIAVNDGSTDSSAEILARRGAACGFDMTVVTCLNGGVSAARNAGLEVALAMPDIDSVMFLDPDDRYLPTCVEKARSAHAEEPEAVVEWAFAMEGFPKSSFSTPDRLEPNVWSKLYPRAVAADVRFCEKTNIAEDIAFNLEIEHRHHPCLLRIEEPLYFYECNSESTMRRQLTARDFERRVETIRHIVSIFEDDQNALDAVCHNEVPELLKQFWRDLRRVLPEDLADARAQFAGLVRLLKSHGLLHPKRGRMKDLKYYLRFFLMS